MKMYLYSLIIGILSLSQQQEAPKVEEQKGYSTPWQPYHFKPSSVPKPMAKVEPVVVDNEEEEVEEPQVKEPELPQPKAIIRDRTPSNLTQFAAIIGNIPNAAPLAPPVARNGVEIKKLSQAHEAVSLCSHDLQNIPEQDWIYTRWIWRRDPTIPLAKVDDLTLNFASQAGKFIYPPAFANWHMSRVDLRRLARDAGVSLKEVIDAWEELRFCPDFAWNITQGEFLVLADKSDVPKVRIRKGNTFTEVPFVSMEDAAVVRVAGRHLNEEELWELEDAVGSQAPVVEAEYLRWRMLTTIQIASADAKKAVVWKTIYSGLYYEFAGIRESKDEKKTDEQLFFEDIGIPNDALDKSEDGESHSIQDSDVTGRIRRVRLKWARLPRPTMSIPLVGITDDVALDSIGADQDVLLNTRKPQADAHEILAPGRNGLLKQLLSNGEGKRQRFVPNSIASNRKIPNPHPPILEGIVGCIQCHYADGHDGWIPITNDVTKLSDVMRVFGDTGLKNINPFEAEQKFEELYGGNADKVLRQAREAQQELILAIVGDDGQGKITEVSKRATQLLSDRYNAHRYNKIGAQQALVECGWLVPEEHATVLFNMLAAPPGIVDGVIVLEDPRIGKVRAGIKIDRTQWDFVKNIAAARIQAAMSGLPMPKQVEQLP